MRILGIANSIYRKQNAETLGDQATDSYKATHQTSSKMDRVEISSKAYEAHANDERLTATSGKDTLGITRGGEDGLFVIHFPDSAMVSRAVSRGYITVNGINMALTDDIKQQLTQTDQQAQTDREQAYSKFIMQHELAVARQQGEAYHKVAEDMSKAFETVAKLSKGGKVSPSEERKLLEMNPQMYAMAIMAASMAKQQKKQADQDVQLPERNREVAQAVEEVDWSSFEWKSYETDLTVSMLDTVQLQGVSEGEIDL